MTKKIDLWEEHAKEKASLPENWHAYKWECFPKTGETIYVAVTGAVCESLEANGNRNWKLRDKSTERTVNLPKAEHYAWKLAWEKRTGKCFECSGTGEVMQSWSASDGFKFRVCLRCNGNKTPQT